MAELDPELDKLFIGNMEIGQVPSKDILLESREDYQIYTEIQRNLIEWGIPVPRFNKSKVRLPQEDRGDEVRRVAGIERDIEPAGTLIIEDGEFPYFEAMLAQVSHLKRILTINHATPSETSRVALAFVGIQRNAIG